MFNTNDYREVLKDNLEKRCQINPSYSLSAFARDIKLPATRLCQVLQKKQGLSVNTATQIADSLNFSKKESDVFCTMVMASDARSKTDREVAYLKLEIYKKTTDQKLLTSEMFNVISEWYYYSILELTTIKDFKYDYQWIAKKLGLGESIVKIAVERLKRLKLIEEQNGTIVQTHNNLKTDDGIPSDAIRTFNKQILDKAKTAIDLQNVHERKIDTLTIGISEEDLQEYYKKINDFYDELDSWAMNRKREKKPDHVYCMATQLFKLSQ